MRVTRLEIFGFKSFMDRIVLPLEGGITGVVGPNGCGKSNVVDALRWILGETRASSLRGGVLEDIIFNGTETLRPLGLAEVSITLRATDKDLFSELCSNFKETEFFDEVLNEDLSARKIAPPATDDTASPEVEGEVTAVEELAEGVAAVVDEGGRPKLTVIDGGIKEESAADSSPDTAAASEAPTADTAIHAEAGETATQDAPASGDSQGAGPTEDSTQSTKSKEPPQFLMRFSWLKGVQEVQVTRRIYRSGESEFFINRVSSRLKDIKEFFRVVGMSARSHTIVAQGEVGRLVSAKPEDRRLVLEEAAGVHGFRDKISAAARRLEETSINISRLDDIIKEVTKQVGSLKRQAQRAQLRQELKSRITEIDRTMLLDGLSSIDESFSKVRSQQEESSEREALVSAKLQKLTAEEQQLRADLMTIDVESDQRRVKIDALREEINNRMRQRTVVTSRINEIKAFSASRDAELSRLKEQFGTLDEREKSAVTEGEALVAKERELAVQLENTEREARDDLEQATRRLEEGRNNLRAREHEMRSIREQMVAAESSLKTIRAQLVAASPVEQVRRALGLQDGNALLNGEQAMLLVEGLEVPKEFERAVQAILKEQAGFLVSDEPHQVGERFLQLSTRLSAEKRSAVGIGVVRKSAAREVSRQSAGDLPALATLVRARPGFEGLLDRLFGNVFVAPSITEAVRIVSEPGNSAITVVTRDGEVVTSDRFMSFRQEGGLIPLVNRLNDLERERGEVGGRVQTLAETISTLERSVREMEQERNAALARVSERQRRIREISNELGATRGRMQSALRLREQVQSDRGRLQRQIVDCERALDEYRKDLVQVEAQLATLVPDDEAGLREQVAELTAQNQEFEKGRSERRRAVAMNASAVDAVRKELEGVRQAASDLSLRLQRSELERQNLIERYQNEYGVEALSGIESQLGEQSVLTSEARAELSEEVHKLRARIIREGDVDPASIEQYEVERKRLDDLVTQKNDLEEAAATLRSTIGRLTETSRVLFMRTFEAVRKNFTNLIPRLFGGGKGDLVLSDPEKPLDSGVEILIRPPGKKLKSIELLSGGEKALCATGLIMAMFLERPSPLCVLDEVDAPLDESNLVRFVSMVKEMSAHTQFLMITHNKQSMAQADHLVGVTMQEPGASRIITVSLQEAYSQVA